VNPIRIIRFKVTADPVQIHGQRLRQNDFMILAEGGLSVALGIPARSAKMLAVTTINCAFTVGHMSIGPMDDAL
jgi:hypothetical protein